VRPRRGFAREEHLVRDGRGEGVVCECKRKVSVL
jgi:hypothetical protein